MRKPPLRERWGWLVIEEFGAGERINEMLVRFRVRVWHPGFWLFFLKCKLGRLVQHG